MRDPLPFTPGEALILLDPARWHGREAIKATLLGLLARGALRLETQLARGLFRRRTTALRVAFGPMPPLPPQERTLVELVRGADRPGVSGGGSMAAVVGQARAQFGADLKGFDRDLVRPGLIRRGLLTEAYKPVLLMFRRRCDALTPAGENARQAVDLAMRQVREIPSVIERDPAAAAALALGAGAAVFLVPEIRAYYAQLSAAMNRKEVADIDVGDSGDLFGGSDNFGGGGTDWSCFDLSGFDFAAFDSIDSAMASFDSSFDSAADSGGDGGGGDGGDGGGGDGGGSGC